MRLLIQRVKNSSVTVADKQISSIGRGLLVLFGACETDTGKEMDWLAKKLVNLRIFEDENGKMNLSVKDIAGEIMLVSQFTLYANCEKGNRPSFIASGAPKKAEKLYHEFANLIKDKYQEPKLGMFGADMKVELLNDGPVTIMLER